jgi:hypothetical protein
METVRDRIVGRSDPGSLDVRMIVVFAEGSSSSFRNAFAACSEPSCGTMRSASPITKTLREANAGDSAACGTIGEEMRKACITPLGGAGTCSCAEALCASDADLQQYCSLSIGKCTCAAVDMGDEKACGHIPRELARLHALGAAWGAGELRLLSPVATGGWRGCGGEMLDAEQRAAVSRFHAAANRAGSGPVVASAARLESEALFGCGAGFHHLFVDSAGEVCPCDLTPLSFGNALEEPLAAIWARMGERFELPRCRCLMAEVASRIPPGPLPLPRAQSEALVPERRPDQPLPGGFSRLFR